MHQREWGSGCRALSELVSESCASVSHVPSRQHLAGHCFKEGNSQSQDSEQQQVGFTQGSSELPALNSPRDWVRDTHGRCPQSGSHGQVGKRHPGFYKPTDRGSNTRIRGLVQLEILWVWKSQTDTSPNCPNGLLGLCSTDPGSKFPPHHWEQSHTLNRTLPETVDPRR